MLRRMTFVRSDVSEERIASIITVTRIRELGTLAVTSNGARCEEMLLYSSLIHAILIIE
jgi:hypothetical protein